MKRSLLIAAVALLLLAPPAFAAGRAGPPPPSIYAPSWRDGAPSIAARAAWRGGETAVERTVATGSAAVDEMRRFLGAANPTGTIGPWCADFVSFVFRRVGLRPLANRLAASALDYGPLTASPRAGDLVVMRHHVGVFVGFDAAGRVVMISGNWGHRVAESAIARRLVVAFVRVG